MRNISLNITAMGLYISGIIVLCITNIWNLITHENMKFKVSSSNLAVVLAMVIAITLTQIEIYNKNTIINSLRTTTFCQNV
jgi:hypothetical protein